MNSKENFALILIASVLSSFVCGCCVKYAYMKRLEKRRSLRLDSISIEPIEIKENLSLPV
jgi:hypothetical protein